MGLGADVEQLVRSQRNVAYRPGLATDLAALATVNLFQITGGDIIVLGIHGTVTTVIGAVGATTLAMTLTCATSAIVTPMAAASAGIANDPVESVYTITGAVAVAITRQVGAARGVGVYQLTNLQVLVPGIIGLVVGASVNTGVIDWVISYVPTRPGVSVVPV